MYKDITSVEEAIKRLGDPLDMTAVEAACNTIPGKYGKGMLALLKLQLVVEAVNNDDPNEPSFEPDYNNSDQLKWFPWYVGGDKSGAGFRFDGSDDWWTNASACGGARLALKSRDRADHMNEHFQDLYKELYLILQ